MSSATTGSERIARSRANLHDLGNWATPAEWAQASNEYVAAAEDELRRLRKVEEGVVSSLLIRVVYTVSCGTVMEGGMIAYEDSPQVCFTEAQARECAGYLIDDYDVASIWEHRFDHNGWKGSSSIERLRMKEDVS